MSNEDIDILLRSVIDSTTGGASHGYLRVPPAARLPLLLEHDWSPPHLPVGSSPASPLREFHSLVAASALVARFNHDTNIHAVIQRVVTPSSSQPTFADLVGNDDTLVQKI